MPKLRQKRIAELNPITDPEIDSLINNSETAAKWSAAIDYVVPDPGDSDEQIDECTRQIPMSRIGLLTKTRLVPQAMLPHKIDNVIDGHMEIPAQPDGDWVFTDTATGDNYVCPKATAPDKQPVIDTVYRDVRTVAGKNIYTQYRYVADPEHAGEPGEETGHFVPIPSDLVMKDGIGTFVSDDDTAYTRQIDIEIGAPAAEPEPATGDVKKILFVDSTNNKLHHGTSGVSSGTYPAGQVTAPDFGEDFKGISMTVDSTGHVNSASTVAITVPSTPARNTMPGLVKIGTGAMPIGDTCSPGTYDPHSGYPNVSAADHQHNASILTLTNTNDGTKTYRGSTDVTYDFDNFLKVPLPDAAPASAGLVLTTESSNNVLVSTWKDPRTVITPRYAFIPVGSSQCTTSSSGLILGAPTENAGIDVDNTGRVTGLDYRKMCLVNYNLELSRATAGTYLDEFTLEVRCLALSAGRQTHVINESITGTGGISNFISGSMIISPLSVVMEFYGSVTRTGSTWTIVGGEIQIAEVK